MIPVSWVLYFIKNSFLNYLNFKFEHSQFLLNTLELE
ncbi:hypothetical protein CUZ56_02502 [Saezia sanguinis]|uniref:Uncharacterized protein n=1 Tax=Saezia sanguinis TaxID=1965230 RepID=A0A433SAZ8_9BURK|nr:hypothetical protein CUZ56_02502 [Saezia sanguinis]